MSSQKRYDIFLSHNSKDKPSVEILAKQLREAAFDIWLDKDCLYAGDALPKEIEKGIEYSKVALFCIGEYGLGKWQDLEMNVCRSLSVNERIKIIVVLLPPLEILPDEYLLLQYQVYVKWEIGNPNTTQQIIDSVSTWLPIWGEKELKRLTAQRNDAEKKLKEIEENIQQVERELGIEIDPLRRKASDWLTAVRNQIEQYAKKALQKFPRLAEQLKEQDSGLIDFCTELDACLEFIYFAFRTRDYVFLHSLHMEYSILEFDSRDEKENREIYKECLNIIANLIPSEAIGVQTKDELESYFNYLFTHILSLI